MKVIEKYGDIIVGAFYVLFGIGLFIASQSIVSFVDAPLGPDFLPKVIAAFMFVIGIIVICAGIKSYKNYEEKAKEDEFKPSYIRLGITALLMVGYIYFLSSIGFIPTTFAYIIAQIHLVTPKEQYSRKLIFKSVVIALIASVGLYYLFYYVFQVFLPQGIWF